MFKINQNLVDDFVDKINEKEKKSNKVTSLSSSSTNTQYPSAKAVYDAINDLDIGGEGSYINDYYFDSTTNEIVLDYTNDGSGSGGGGSSGGSSVDIVTNWEQTTSNEKVPSEKLVKDSLDSKSDITHTHSQYLTEHQSLTNYVQKSSTVGLLKNDGSVMTGGTGSSNYAIGNHTHSNYVNPTIADNLTTNDASQVLSAKQGKILNDLIGEAITYINK